MLPHSKPSPFHFLALRWVALFDYVLEALFLCGKKGEINCKTDWALHKAPAPNVLTCTGSGNPRFGIRVANCGGAFVRLVAILIFYVCCCPAEFEISASEIATVAGVSEVSFIRLLSRPEEYDGKIVATMGYYKWNFEERALFATKEAAELDDTASSIQIELGNTNVGTRFRELPSGYVRVQGVFTSGRRELSISSGGRSGILGTLTLSINNLSLMAPVGRTHDAFALINTIGCILSCGCILFGFFTKKWKAVLSLAVVLSLLWTGSSVLCFIRTSSPLVGLSFTPFVVVVCCAVVCAARFLATLHGSKRVGS
jgi:hypothetical protein